MKIKFILAFAWFYGYSSVKRAPVYILAYLSLPISLLFFIYVISKGELISYGILGGLISIIVENSISLIGDFAFMKRELKIQDLLVATEISPLDYMMGLTLGNLIFSLPGLFIYVTLGFLFHVFTALELLIVIPVLIILLLSTTSLSITLASLIKHTRHSWGVSTVMTLILTILPPLYYPYAVLPSWALDLLYLSPATPASVFLQGFLGMQDFSIFPLLIFLVESAILLVLPFTVLKWRES